MRSLLPLLTLTAIAGCTYAPAAPIVTSPEAEAQATALLAGRIPGAPERCLPTPATSQLIPLPGNRVGYRYGSVIYVSVTDGSCAGLGGNTTLVTRPLGLNLTPCRGDTAYVVDSSSGATLGSCTFGDFIPYRLGR